MVLLLYSRFTHTVGGSNQMIGALTNHLWQSTLFVVAAWLLTFAFRRNGAHVRYRIWFVASLKFFVPFAVLINLGSHFGWPADAKNATTPAVSFSIAQIAEPFADVSLLAPATAGTR